jgi:hypothetical protein
VPAGRVLIIRGRDGLYGLRLRKSFASRTDDAYRAVFDVATWTPKGWRTTSAMVEELPLRGFGHPFAFQPGHTRLELGSLSLTFNGPNCISMYEAGSDERDDLLSFAPTAWQSFAAVDVHAAALQWYGVDPQRTIELPLAGLPGAIEMR